jgi:Toxin PAAR-like domain/GHH signature containing HNH/Endo VII superfamily nuclease toxin  2
MTNKVFANGMEIACKAGSGKVIAAFPDVCMTPPENPATPPGVPVPYPDTALASDTAKGSKKVKISDKEIMLKNKSYFKTLSGNEAGCTAKKGVVSSKIKGKVYFVKWSMDVKVEGENVDRHLDLTTNNHGSPQANEAAPWPFVDSSTLASDHPCKDEKKKEEEACGKTSSPPNPCTQKCKAARRCHLTPYDGTSSPNCCDPEVAHHIVPMSLLQSDRPSTASNVTGLRKSGPKAYTEKKALCVCTSGKRDENGNKIKTPIGSHKKMHDKTKAKLQAILMAGKELTLEDSIKSSAKAHNETFRKSDGSPQCRQKCIESQLKNQFKQCGTGSEVKVRQQDGATCAKYDKYRAGNGGT